MSEQLFLLLDSLVDRENEIKGILEVLGGEENAGFLNAEIVMAERMIVQAYGGNDGHYAHVASSNLFCNYESRKTDEAKKELIDYIKLTIDNDWTDEVEMVITFG